MSEKESIDQETAELQSPDNWEFDAGVLHRASKKRRTVVSVAFPNEDLQLVSAYAERIGVKVSVMIREAAIEKASSVNETSWSWAGGSSGSYFMPSGTDNFTHVSVGVTVEEETEEKVRT